MKKLGVIAILCFFLIAFHVQDASAHSGRTDSLGGHFRTSDCMYMFHHPTKSVVGKTKSKIVSLIKKYNSNKKCTRSLTTKKVMWSTIRYKH